MRHLSELDGFLAERVIGQPHALAAVSKAVKRAEVGLASPSRPKGSFLLLGPTGVGKTETALGLAEFFFGSRDALVRIDMAEYMERSSIGRLLGESKDEQGLLGDGLDRYPNGGVLLFDEIEKAHRDVSTILLSILDAGHVTMSTGKRCDVSRWYVICTSNLGSSEAIKMERVPYATLCRHVLAIASAFFRPEILVRFPEQIVYARLTFEAQKGIAVSMIQKEMANVQKALGLHFRNPPSVCYEGNVVNHLVGKGYSRFLGARPMRHTIEREIGAAVVELLTEEFPQLKTLSDDTAQTNWSGPDKLTLAVREKKLLIERPSELKVV